jgi:D-alanyl-D-alanine carboxypeptidase
MRYSILLWLVLSLGALTPYPAAAAESASALAQLSSTLDSARNAAGIPGLVIAVNQRTQRDFLALGQADVAGGRPMQARDHFAVGSITKMFTAVIVLQLAAEGKLKLDDPLSLYQPDFPNAANITLRQLLNHSSGIHDYLELKLPLELIPLVAMERFTPQEVVHFAAQLDPYFPPGQGFHYSNTNFFILGLVIEQVTGQSYYHELRRRIIEPLGLQQTFFAGVDELPTDMAHGYALVNGEPRDRSYWENASLAWAAGGIVSNADDLCTFIEALATGKLIGEPWLGEMKTGVKTNGSDRYGLGLQIFEVPGGTAFGHSGETLGFTCDLYYQPQNDRALAVLTNLAFCRTQNLIALVLGMSDTASQP